MTSIGEFAFAGCSGLTNINIPNSLTSIGESAFIHCQGLTSIIIPSSVTNIGIGVFSGCTSLTSICVDANNCVYDSRDECNAIIETSTNNLIIGCSSSFIPNSVTKIEDWAFNGCTGLTSINIPNSVTSIGGGAFFSCTGLTSINIPNSATSIGERVFDNCSSLRYNVYGNGLYLGNDENPYFALIATKFKDIPNIDINDNCVLISDAFSVCTDLTSIVIPNKVTFIGQSAFSGCTSLASVVIPKSVTSILDSAFEGCTELKKVYNLSSLTFTRGTTDYGQVAKYAYYVYNNCLMDGDYVIIKDNDKKYVCGYIGSETNLVLPKVDSICDGAFYCCKELSSINIPNRIISIGQKAFFGCTGLTSINLPNSLTTIGRQAFSSCTGLTSINLPNSLTSIGKLAFAGCTGLTNINIPNSITSIEQRTFYGCSGLTSINIPNSVSSIGERVFDGCTNLNAIYCNALTPPTCHGWVFNSGTQRNCPLYVPAASLYDYKTASVWKDFLTILENPEYSGIECLTSEDNTSASMFNLQGQMVSTPTKGKIYIQNGKKFLMK